jgi:diguanylate cyclase (GGDEF)-like protein
MPKLSLRALLIIPFVLLILILTAVVAWLSYDASQRTAVKLIDNLTVGVAQRVRSAVESHMAPSHLVLEATIPSLREHLENRVDAELSLDAIEAKLRATTRLNLNPNNYIYYGNIANQFVGVSRTDDNQLELRIKADPTKPRLFFSERSQSAINAVPIAPLKTLIKTETTLYDPQSRPWFKAASQAKAPVWTSVYTAFSSKELITTLAHPIYRRNGTLEGVLSTDVALAKINDFLSSVPVSPNGVAVLLEANGDLIATSTGAPLFVEVGGVKQRANAAKSDNRLIRETYTQFAAQLNGAPFIEPVIHDFALDKSLGSYQFGTIHATLDDINDRAGLKWYSIIAVPHEDFMAGARGFAWRSVLLGLLAAAIAMLLGYTVVNHVARDLKVLNDATKAVATGQPAAALPIARNDEIGDLARQFERMHIDLQEDKLTGAVNRETFTRIVTRRFGAQAGANAAPLRQFALLFIDLNKFKLINDIHGHLIGDDVLIAVATRTREASRASDIVARFGGDEFVVLLDDVTNPASAGQVAQKILTAISQPLVLQQGITLTITAAVGIAFYPDDGEDLESLLKVADEKMYQHKGASKR